MKVEAWSKGGAGSEAVCGGSGERSRDVKCAKRDRERRHGGTSIEQCEAGGRQLQQHTRIRERCQEKVAASVTPAPDPAERGLGAAARCGKTLRNGRATANQSIRCGTGGGYVGVTAEKVGGGVAAKRRSPTEVGKTRQTHKGLLRKKENQLTAAILLGSPSEIVHRRVHRATPESAPSLVSRRYYPRSREAFRHCRGLLIGVHH